MLRKIMALIGAVLATWLVLSFFISLGWAWHMYWKILS
ncbi:hypothetical protein JJJA_0011 [Achromobacter phage JWDelta]|uniref:Uncharacterized protein n=2 Tax=Jwalphavirus jwalpha TaxID=2169963 RepID=V9VEF0_9CAUD|nr:hypothetical protein CH29_gp11 [Achromobacter phage JWAlpha]AHC56527.1 hypothetical protein JJJA_0011 [Achromobacter phage JWDelta]AHC93964.1 hypothetical protein JJJB_0011 [Achromobacter phage JWAlpha]